MKKICVVIAVVVLLAAVSAQAEVLLFEDWETGMDGWVPYGAEPYATLSPDANTTPGGMWSLKTPDNVMTSYAGAVDWNFASETSANWYVKFNFCDTGSTREYLQIQSYSPDATFQNLYALGAYHSVTNGMMYYASRIAAGSTNWQPTPVLRTPGWHSMMIQQDASGLVTFFVDGVVADQRITTAVYGATKIRVGSGLTNGGYGAYYDDIEFGVVPEPSSLAALAACVAGCAGLWRRRRN